MRAKLIWHFNSLVKTARFSLSKSEKIKLTIPESERPAIYFHFSKQEYRFYLPIIRAFHKAGYNCCINFNYKFISNADNFLKWTHDLNRVYFCLTTSGIENCRLIIRDSQATEVSSKIKTLTISDQIYDAAFKPKKQNILPFAMHPDQYLNFEHSDTAVLRNKERKVRVFFSGNVSEEGYKDEIINELHHKLSRNQMLQGAKTRLPEEVVHEMNIQPEAPFQNRIVLLTSDFWVNDAVKQHTIKKSDWFTYLASADFFLACPGFSHPMCHNLIESMAVGTIPILEHAEYLHPNLTHGVNCISFKGEADMIEKLKQVLSLSPAQIAEMRTQVIAYYEAYLAPEFIVKELETAPDKTTFFYYSSAQSVRMFYDKFRKQKTA